MAASSAVAPSALSGKLLSLARSGTSRADQRPSYPVPEFRPSLVRRARGDARRLRVRRCITRWHWPPCIVPRRRESLVLEGGGALPPPVWPLVCSTVTKLCYVTPGRETLEISSCRIPRRVAKFGVFKIRGPPNIHTYTVS